MEVKFLNKGIFWVNGQFLKESCCNFNTNGNYYCQYFPFKQNGLPVAFNLTLGLHNLACDNQTITIYNLTDSFEIEAVDSVYTPYISPTPLLQEEFVVQNLKHVATIYYDSNLRLIIENDYAFINHNFAEKLVEPKIMCESNTFFVTSLLESKKVYFAVFIYDCKAKNYSLALENVVDSFNVTENGICSYHNLNGMLDCQRQDFYSFNNGEYKNVKTKFKYNKAHNYPIKLYPYLFLEGLLFDDVSLIKSICAKEIYENIDMLTQYFGNFKLLNADSTPLGGDVPILVKQNNTYIKKIVTFDFDFDKISNIIIN